MTTTSRPILVLASRNHKKMVELRRMLDVYPIELATADQYADAPEVEETGATFAENAALKGSQTATAVGEWALADDSGLAVDYLDGAPGVYSARYAGEDASDEANNQKLLEALAGIPPERRGAEFVCNLALSDPRGEIRIQVEASCRGRIVEQPLGIEGFGYDPLFWIPEYHQTFGQLGLAIKDVLSHRSRALRRMIPRMVALWHAERRFG